MGADTRHSFHLQDPREAAPRPCAGTGPSRAALNPPGRAAPSSSRREDEVEGLALGRGHVGVPQVHHEHHAGTLLRGTCGDGSAR